MDDRSPEPAGGTWSGDFSETRLGIVLYAAWALLQYAVAGAICAALWILAAYLGPIAMRVLVHLGESL